MKVCSKCGQEKPLDKFYQDKRLKEGLTSRCRLCLDKISKAYYNKNKEELLEKQKQYYENNRDKIVHRSNSFYKDNKDVILERHKEYRKDNKEKILLNKKNYYEKNKEKILINKKIYRKKVVQERDLKRKYNLTLKDWHKMWDDQKGLCGWCGKKMIKTGNSKHRAVVDHNHKPPYEVRMLCHNYCNMTHLPPFENDLEGMVIKVFSYPFPKDEKLAAYKKLKELYDGIS